MAHGVDALEAQIFRKKPEFDLGMHGEIELCADQRPTGRKINLQVKFGAHHLKKRKRDGKEVFRIDNPNRVAYWANHSEAVFLLIMQSTGRARWMNLTKYLHSMGDQKPRTSVFDGMPF